MPRTRRRKWERYRRVLAALMAAGTAGRGVNTRSALMARALLVSAMNSPGAGAGGRYSQEQIREALAQRHEKRLLIAAILEQERSADAHLTAILEDMRDAS